MGIFSEWRWGDLNHQVTKYNYVLRTNSTKCLQARLTRDSFLSKESHRSDRFNFTKAKQLVSLPFHRKHKTTQKGGYVLVDISGKTMNHLKTYLEKFLLFYKSCPNLQNALGNA